MALTGIGASLFWDGRRGGVGASLLDLSARGAVKKGGYGGALVFRDTSVINFVLFEAEFEELCRLVPEAAFEEEALDEARELLDLLERMKADGRRALDEFAGELIALDVHLDELRQRVEGGTTFQARDAARAEAAEVQDRLANMRQFLRALLVEHGLGYREFAVGTPLAAEQARLLSIAGPAPVEEAPLPVAQIARARDRAEFDRGKELVRNVVRVLFVVLLLAMAWVALTAKH